MNTDWKEKIRSGCNLHVRRAANGGVMVEEASFNGQHMFETLIAASDTVQFFALLAEAMEVTPEQIARERDHLQGVDTNVVLGIDPSVSQAYRRDLEKRLRSNMPMLDTAVFTDDTPSMGAQERR